MLFHADKTDREISLEIGFHWLYVLHPLLGGRAMPNRPDEQDLRRYFNEAIAYRTNLSSCPVASRRRS
ncbi:hypothetical protein OH492_23325 [Vibrio chagasii]|nr:hypothetical protein [Vibrio chagasii]